MTKPERMVSAQCCDDASGTLSERTKDRLQELIDASGRGEVRGVIICWEDFNGCSRSALEGRGDSLAFLAQGVVDVIGETLLGGSDPPPRTARH